MSTQRPPFFEPRPERIYQFRGRMYPRLSTAKGVQTAYLKAANKYRAANGLPKATRTTHPIVTGTVKWKVVETDD